MAGAAILVVPATRRRGMGHVTVLGEDQRGEVLVLGGKRAGFDRCDAVTRAAEMKPAQQAGEYNDTDKLDETSAPGAQAQDGDARRLGQATTAIGQRSVGARTSGGGWAAAFPTVAFAKRCALDRAAAGAVGLRAIEARLVPTGRASALVFPQRALVLLAFKFFQVRCGLRSVNVDHDDVPDRHEHQGHGQRHMQEEPAFHDGLGGILDVQFQFVVNDLGEFVEEFLLA